MRIVLFIAVFDLLAGAASLSAADAIDYSRDIKPLLTARCYACHGALKQRGGLRMDTAALLLQGGDRGPVAIPGNSRISPVLQRVTTNKASQRMPPVHEGEALTPAEISKLQSWIDQGATAPADEKPERDPKEHWAFRAPVRPQIPAISRTGGNNPIDAFIAIELEQRGIVSQPEAEQRLLLRRVYLDLIGLPPTREEIAAFVADASPNAYEKVVDRLLASPRYGERWGRHWMDIWRYSDWWGLGAEVRNSQKHIWHWRDWIVESLNADKGYDQMLREMLAADELYPNDLDKLRGTGYLARSYFKFNRTTWLDEVVEHTSKAFLGLTLNCAKCHDHKYDPIAQNDYYRLRAFFEPYQVRTDQLPGQVDLEKDGLPRVFDCNLTAPTYRFVRGDERQPMTDKPLSPGLPALLAMDKLVIQPVELPPEAHTPGLRAHVLNDLERDLSDKATRATRSLHSISQQSATTGEKQATAHVLAAKTAAAAEAEFAAFKARTAAERARWRGWPSERVRTFARQAFAAEQVWKTAQAEENVARADHEMAQADGGKKPAADKKLRAAREALKKARDAAAIAGENYTPIRGAQKMLESNMETEESRLKPFPTTSTGRRSALAIWMTDRRHPLTARVAVNHIWARHFGRPLVPTVFDFGRKGAPPSHPALLDYLATQLMDNQWSMKHIHRLIVCSQSYRMSSSGAKAPASHWAADPENRWYWRRPFVRMEAQVVRDSLLHLAGELDSTIGGPSIQLARQDESSRRSLYFVHSHNEHHKFLALFDDASVLECYRRAESIVPQQALALENSRLALRMAERITRRLQRELGDVSDARFIQSAFEAVLGCSPTPDESAACLESLRQIRDSVQSVNPTNDLRARMVVLHALLNHNDFVTIR